MTKYLSLSSFFCIFLGACAGDEGNYHSLVASGQGGYLSDSMYAGPASATGTAAYAATVDDSEEDATSDDGGAGDALLSPEESFLLELMNATQTDLSQFGRFVRIVSLGFDPVRDTPDFTVEPGLSHGMAYLVGYLKAKGVYRPDDENGGMSSLSLIASYLSNGLTRASINGYADLREYALEDEQGLKKLLGLLNADRNFSAKIDDFLVRDGLFPDYHRPALDVKEFTDTIQAGSTLVLGLAKADGTYRIALLYSVVCFAKASLLLFYDPTVVSDEREAYPNILVFDNFRETYDPSHYNGLSEVGSLRIFSVLPRIEK